MNKKAQIFEGILLLIVLGVCSYATYTMLTLEKNVRLELSLPVEISNIEKEQLQLGFFLQENMKIAREQAYYETAKKPGGADCLPYEHSDKTYILWDKECKPENLLEDNSKQIFAELVKEKEITYTLEFGENIKLNYEKNFYKELEEKTINYTIKKEIKEGIEITYTDDFLEVYNELINKEDRASAVLENWEIADIKSDDNNDYISLISKKEYLFFDGEEKYEKIGLNIAFTS